MTTVSILTLIAAVIAAIVAGIGVYFQRKTGRESARAAQQSASAATEAAAAATKSADSAMKMAELEGQGRTQDRRTQRANSIVVLLQALLTPPRMPPKSSASTEFVEYRKALVIWTHTTYAAFPLAWEATRSPGLMPFVAFDHVLLDVVQQIEERVARLVADLDDSNGAPANQSYDELKEAVNTLENQVNALILALRALL